MKNCILLLGLTSLAFSAAAQQGTIAFSNGTGLVKQWISPSDSGPVNVGFQGGYVQLYYAPAGTAYTAWDINHPITPAAWYASNPGWILAASPTIIAPLNNPVMFGKFNGGALTLTGINAGANIDYVVVGWLGSAPSFDAAYVNYQIVGVSPRFTSGTGGAGDPPSPPTPLSTSFGGMVLSPSPEPSTFALAGLGAAALLIFRPRR